MSSRDYKLYQTMSNPDNIKECKLYVDEDWGVYGLPVSWGRSDIKSYFIHRCSKFKQTRMNHYWINVDKDKDPLYDVNCHECHASAPGGLQAIWRFHNLENEIALIFMEKAV